MKLDSLSLILMGIMGISLGMMGISLGIIGAFGGKF